MEAMLRLCDRCEHPLISTMAFRGAEWYCPNCGMVAGMFSGHRVKVTPSRIRKHEGDLRWWAGVRKHLFIGGECLVGCPKCEAVIREPHTRHLTDEEKEKQAWALAQLEARKAKKYRKESNPKGDGRRMIWSAS